MKLISKFCRENNCTYSLITYRFWGIRVKRKGIDIIKNGFILVSLEPIHYANGDKWIINNIGSDYEGPRYLKRISKSFLDILAGLKPTNDKLIY